MKKSNLILSILLLGILFSGCNNQVEDKNKEKEDSSEVAYEYYTGNWWCLQQWSSEDTERKSITNYEYYLFDENDKCIKYGKYNYYHTDNPPFENKQEFDDKIETFKDSGFNCEWYKINNFTQLPSWAKDYIQFDEYKASKNYDSTLVRPENKWKAVVEGEDSNSNYCPYFIFNSDGTGYYFGYLRYDSKMTDEILSEYPEEALRIDSLVEANFLWATKNINGKKYIKFYQQEKDPEYPESFSVSATYFSTGEFYEYTIDETNLKFSDKILDSINLLSVEYKLY